MSVVWAIIPARYASVRFPGKPLANISGKPMIAWVHAQAKKSKHLQRVVVATDSEEIAKCCKSFGAECVFTSPAHKSGTDRVAEAFNLLLQQKDKDMPAPEWVLNLQGDEPCLNPKDIDRLIQGCLSQKGVKLGTLIYPLEEEHANNPDIVKVVLGAKNKALYFSRAAIPHQRGEKTQRYRHMGIYLFQQNFLNQFTKLQPGALSLSEELEQLRALENGFPIHCFQASTLSHGVDRPKDVESIEKILQKRPHVSA